MSNVYDILFGGLIIILQVGENEIVQKDFCWMFYILPPNFV